MQTKEISVSQKTRQRWWLVALLTILGVAVLVSSLYFLIFPVGYQGGRNPYYGMTLIFDREGWDALHLWTGLGMILILGVHIMVHWNWIKTMVNRCAKRDSCEVGKMNWRAQYNILLDFVAALAFVLAAASGIYLMATPSRSSAVSAPVVIFSWYTWDVIHTWSGIVMFIAVFLHLAIHWGWIKNVTVRIAVKENKKSNQMIEGVENV